MTAGHGRHMGCEGANTAKKKGLKRPLLFYGSRQSRGDSGFEQRIEATCSVTAGDIGQKITKSIQDIP